MTTGQDIALPVDYETGLEDFNPAEAGLPRIKIVHEDGVFVDSQTNQEFPVMAGVMLGLIKQRVMWAKSLEDDSKPLCKSNDAEFGYPTLNGPAYNLFPWSASGMDPARQPKDEEGRTVIKCEGCPFAQWTKKDGKNVPPLCSERWTIPIHFSTDGDTNRLTNAGLISFQRSSLTPLKNFIGAFSRLRVPLFSAFFSMSLDVNKRGTVKYSVPRVKRLGETSQSMWPDYAEEYRSLRDMLRRPPMNPDTSEPTPQATSNDWNPAADGRNNQVVEAQVVNEPDPWAVTQQVTQAEQQWPAAQPATQPVTSPLIGTNLVNAASTPVSASAASVASNDDDLPF